MTTDQWITVAGIAAPVAVALCGVVIRMLFGLHTQMNSRLDELVSLRTQAGHAEGVVQGAADKEEMRRMVKEAVADAFKALPVVPVVVSQLPPGSIGPTIPEKT